MKMRYLCTLAMALSWAPLAVAQSTHADRSNYPAFQAGEDLLLAQYDGKPDPDDVQAMAALGSILVHSDYFSSVNAYGVMNAYGYQGTAQSPNGGTLIIDTTDLMTAIFGAGNWVKATIDPDENTPDSEIPILNENSVETVADLVESYLINGHNVWVTEAGQSDFTAAWIRELQDRDTVSDADIKESVFVVQHSTWNENSTTPSELAFTQANTTYCRIHDGNNRISGVSDLTPGYTNGNSRWLDQALERGEYEGDINPNGDSRELWQLAEDAIQAISEPIGGVISRGGIDFSDTVEAWWVLDMASRPGKREDVWDAKDFFRIFVFNEDHISSTYAEDFESGSSSFSNLSVIDSPSPWGSSKVGAITVPPGRNSVHARHRNISDTSLFDNASAVLTARVGLADTEVGRIRLRARLRVKYANGSNAFLNGSWLEMSYSAESPIQDYQVEYNIPDGVESLIEVRIQARNVTNNTPAQDLYIDDIEIKQ